jgi:hypothetical protein
MVPENKQNRRYKLTLLAFKIIAILHNTLLVTFIKLLETVCKGFFRNQSQNHGETGRSPQAPDQGSMVDD